jgi:hypothetical protein
MEHLTAGRNGAAEREKGRARARPSTDSSSGHHTTTTSGNYTRSRRQLPQAEHCDLGIVDDGSAVGADA